MSLLLRIGHLDNTTFSCMTKHVILKRENSIFLPSQVGIPRDAPFITHMSICDCTKG